MSRRLRHVAESVAAEPTYARLGLDHLRAVGAYLFAGTRADIALARRTSRDFAKDVGEPDRRRFCPCSPSPDTPNYANGLRKRDVAFSRERKADVAYRLRPDPFECAYRGIQQARPGLTEEAELSNVVTGRTRNRDTLWTIDLPERDLDFDGFMRLGTLVLQATDDANPAADIHAQDHYAQPSSPNGTVRRDDRESPPYLAVDTKRL